MPLTTSIIMLMHNNPTIIHIGITPHASKNTAPILQIMFSTLIFSKLFINVEIIKLFCYCVMQILINWFLIEIFVQYVH